jgi:phage-related protein (TIGR01555 family)
MQKRKPSRSPGRSTASSPGRARKRTTAISSPARESKPSQLAKSVRAVTQAQKRSLSNFLEGFGTQRDPYARKLTLPRLPDGLAPGSGMAMDDASGPGPFPYQSYLGNSFSLYFPGYPYLAMLAQRSEYQQPTQTHAKDMTREWIEFTTRGKADKAKKIEEIESRFEELGIQALFRRALLHDGYYGVGHIFIDLKGHDNTKLPVELDPKSIAKGQLRGFRNIEPMWVTPVMWNSAKVELPTFYVPDTYWALDKEMHKSRLLQVISREVPDILKPAYNFGGFSLSQLIEPYVDRWLKTVNGVNRLINNFSLIALMTDMSAVLQDGDTGADLLKRLKLARMHGDNTGIFAMNKATEELVQIAVPLSGLAELQQQAVDHMAYPTHLPLVVLTGVTPSGLNASSDGEIEVYHDWNRSEQNAVIRPKLQHVLDVVQLDMYGSIDREIGFEFKPIKQISGETLSSIKKTEAEQDVAYVDAGIVSPQEVREKVARDPNSGYVNLNVDKLPEAPDEEDPDEEVGGKPAGELVREVA